MLVTIFLLTGISIGLALWHAWKTVVKLWSLPPGPIPLPFCRNGMPDDVHPGQCKWHTKLRQQYGDVFTIYYGIKPVVIVNGYEGLLDVLVRNGRHVQTRPAKTGVLSLLHDNKGLVWNDESYKILRKLCAETLHYKEHQRSLELKLLEVTKNVENQSVDFSDVIKDYVTNTICTSIFGEKCQEIDESCFTKALNLHCNSLLRSAELDPLLSIPLTKYLPGYKDTWLKFYEDKTLFHRFISQRLEERRQASICSDGVDDFIGLFVKNKKKQKLSELDCQATVMQLMLAGLDAVYSTLMWSLLYLTLYPNVQEKLATEIHNVIGKADNESIVQYMSSMPYCQAVINEVLRICNVSFTSLPYHNTQDIHVTGKTIPKNSSICVNLVSIHKDPKLFPEPEKFSPERFLDQNEKLKKFQFFRPFSVGRRSCVGERFSKAQIFTALVTIIERYELRQVSGESYSLDSSQSFLSVPKPYKVYLKSRCH